MKNVHAPARILMAILFLVSGMGKLSDVEGTQKYMEAYGVPGNLLYPAAAFEISSGIALVMGSYTQRLSVALAGWCLLTAIIFHADFEDQNQKINFMKNMVMAGGFLILADHGAPGWSIGFHLKHWREDARETLPMYKEAGI